VPDHPDHEQLAAFQAGDGDRRQRAGVEAHLAGCPSCAEMVASVEQARSRLAVLEEPALPPGLHDRLAAAVAAEAARQAAADGPPSRHRRQASATRELPRPTPWYRRPVAWGAAAALLLAALVAPFLDQAGTLTSPDRDEGGGRAATEAGGADQLPVIRIPGEVSAATVKSRLDADRRAKAALDAATAGAPGGQALAPGASQTPEYGQDEAARSSAPGLGQVDPASLCLPAAAGAADPATRPLTPAFFIEGTYKGREATILVTTSSRAGRVDLWVFPRNDCSSPPLATERVR
jgi:anti-sigma factor RsiW